MMNGWRTNDEPRADAASGEVYLRDGNKRPDFLETEKVVFTFVVSIPHRFLCGPTNSGKIVPL